MPRIPDNILDGVPFLFRTRQEAEARARIGGTAFMVSRPIKGAKEVLGHDVSVPYLVTNRHVVFAGGASVVSFNRRDGRLPDVWEYEPTDWIEHPDGDDVAVLGIKDRFINRVHKATTSPLDALISERFAKDANIGEGDDVFMVGRFINHQGSRTNKPATRFGNISTGPEQIWVQADSRHQLSYAVEMRSRTGFSGSPVFVYRFERVLHDNIPPKYRNFWGILGINWGYILDEHGENTWLNGVVPSWKIMEMFEMPKLKAKHEQDEAEFHEGFRAKGVAAVQGFATASD